MPYQSSILLTYKGKILLFSKEVLTSNMDSIWDFLNIKKVKGGSISEYLQKEINLPIKLKKDSLSVVQVLPRNTDGAQLFHLKLTDKYVNDIERKEGWRLEFYRFSEIEKISLSNDTKNLFTKYRDEIKALLS